jgi:hypothetical protein
MPAMSSSARHLLGPYPDRDRVVADDNMAFVSDDFGARLAFTGGLMVNRDEKSGYGLVVSMLNGDLPGRIEGRYRRWLASNRGVDLGLGVTGGRTRGRYDRDELPTRGLTASVGISGTYLGADARFDFARAEDGRSMHATYLTVRSGSRAAPIVTASGFLAFLGLFALVTRGGNY